MLSAGGRQYKSRKARPCDLCRSRKVACHMKHGPPCRLCKERDRTCTFLMAPTKRKRPVPEAASAAPQAEASQEITVARAEFDYVEEDIPGSAWLTDGANPPDLSPLPLPLDMEPDDLLGSSFHHQPGLAVGHSADRSLHQSSTGSLPVQTLNPANEEESSPVAQTPSSSQSQASGRHFQREPFVEGSVVSSPGSASAERSLDAIPNVTYRAIGFTGDLDLYVLSHRDYDDNDESSVQYRGLRYRRMSARGSQAPPLASQPDQVPAASTFPPLVFAIFDTAFASRSQPRLPREEIEKAEQELRTIITPQLGYRLMLLYTHYVHQSFPILASRQLCTSPEEVHQVPGPLLAAICAASLPFSTYDDVLSVWLPQCPSEDDLFRLAFTLLSDELHTPKLCTIQTLLLLLQRHATNQYVPSTPFRTIISSTIVRLCHCLGLHRDPSQWTTIPLWERQLRRRIWWATWMMEKWTSLGESVPSTLKDDDFDVEPFRASDMETQVLPRLEFDLPPSHFPYLMTLTDILSDVMNGFFTVRAAARMSNSLELCIEAAKPLRAKLKRWHESLPAEIKCHILPAREPARPKRTFHNSGSFCQLDAHGSFYLAYLTVQLTLFRALLRPVGALATLWFQASTAGDAGDDDAAQSEFTIPDDQATAMKAVIKGSLSVVNEVVEFAENLAGAEWDAFWHSWSRTNFAIIAGVMLNLVFILRPLISPLQAQMAAATLQSPTPAASPFNHPAHDRSMPAEMWDKAPRQTYPRCSTNSFLGLHDEYKALLDYLTRWRWTMKISSRGAGGRKGLMNLSLLRLDALLSELSHSASIENGLHRA